MSEKIQDEIIKSLSESNESLRKSSMDYLNLITEQKEIFIKKLEERLKERKDFRKRHLEKTGIDCKRNFIGNFVCSLMNEEIKWLENLINLIKYE